MNGARPIAVKELRLSLRVRNNRLITAREMLGLKARDAAERIGVSYGTLLDLEGLKKRGSPLGANGTWSKTAIRVASFYGGTLEFFWPEAVLAVVEPVRTVEVDAMDAARLIAPASMEALPADSNPEKEAADRELVMLVQEDLSKLSVRCALALTLRFGLNGAGEHTLDEAGEKMGVGGERVRQLVARGIRALRRAVALRKTVGILRPDRFNEW